MTRNKPSVHGTHFWRICP